MRIVIPADGNNLSAKLSEPAKAKYHIIVDIEDGKAIKHEPIAIPHPMGGIAFTLSSKKIDAVVTGDIEDVNRAMFIGVGLRVFPGATGTVSDAIKQLIEGRLDEASDLGQCSCNH